MRTINYKRALQWSFLHSIILWMVHFFLAPLLINLKKWQQRSCISSANLVRLLLLSFHILMQFDFSLTLNILNSSEICIFGLLRSFAIMSNFPMIISNLVFKWSELIVFNGAYVTVFLFSGALNKIFAQYLVSADFIFSPSFSLC